MLKNRKACPMSCAICIQLPNRLGSGCPEFSCFLIANVEQVYQQVHGAGKGVIPATALALSHPAGLRAAEAEAAPEEDKTEKVRSTSDLMWRLGNYKTITCDCGTKLRVPPRFKGTTVRCPHCGRANPV